MRISALALLAALIAYPAGAQPTPGAVPPGASPPAKTPLPRNEAPKSETPKVAAKPAAGSLEEMLATALRNNPDIRVAEAKLREAEANLNKARIQVMQSVVSLKNAVDAQKKTVEIAEHSHKRIMELKSNHVVPEAEVQQSEALLAKAKAELAKLEADLAIPLGRLPGQYDRADGSSNTIMLGGLKTQLPSVDGWSDTLQGAWTLPQAQLGFPGQWTPQAQWQLGLNSTLFNPNQGVRTIVNMPADFTSSVTVKSGPGSIADKIRTALDKPIKVEWKQPMPLTEVIEFLRSKAETDVPIRILVDTASKQERIDLMNGELPLGAWLQAVEDSIPQLMIVVRDYGLVVTTRGRLPQDAEPVRDFWRRAKAQKMTETEKVATPPKAK
jgi:hypothetical protein